MYRMCRPLIVVVVLFALSLSACSESKKGSGTGVDATEDTVSDTVAPSDTIDTGLDTVEDTFVPFNPFASKEVLLLDFDMQHPVAWRPLAGALEPNGYSLTYRRWFPHVTLTDISPDPETGAYPYTVIVVSAGSGPGHPTEIMRVDDATRLVAFVNAGGTLVIMPRNGWGDSYTGEAEWLHFNRVLEELKVGVRIERNTLIGHVSLPQAPKPPLHVQTLSGYPGTLEWTLNSPIIYPPLDHPAASATPYPFAGGYLPSLSCDDDAVAVLARTHSDVILWWKLGDADDKLSLPGTQEPVAVISSSDATAGVVAVVPRSFSNVIEHSEQASDKPVTNPAILGSTQTALNVIISHTLAVTVDRGAHAPQGCKAGKLPLFSAVGGGLEPVGGGPQETALYPVSIAPVAPTPPTPPSWAGTVTDDVVLEPVKTVSSDPPWFTDGRAHMAYGGYMWSGEDMEAALTLWAGLGVDGLVVTIEPQWLVDYGMGDPSITGPFETLSSTAAALGIKVYLGVHYIWAYNALQSSVGTSVGAYGQELAAPPPLNETWWNDGLKPIVMGAAKVIQDYPGIGGLHIDTELYNAGGLWYHAGQMFDADTWARTNAALAEHDADLALEVDALAANTRLAWLIDRGLWGFVLQALEDKTAARAKTLLDEAREIAPQMDLAFYSPIITTAWFYKGLMRGWGSADRPVVVLSYDIETAALRRSLASEDVHVRFIGGLLGVLFEPNDFGKALVTCGSTGDGYWLFQFSDFPDTDNPDILATKHAPPSAYWDALKAANDTLKGLLPTD